MRLSRLSVERPVFAIVVNLLLVVMGAGSILRLPVRQYPDVDQPIVSISTTFFGASAQVVESEVTQLIEESVSGIEGIRTIQSTSRDENSQINIEFTLDRDIDFAAADVRDQVARVLSRLPEDTEDPIIAKASSSSNAMMWITLSSDSRDTLDLTDYAIRNLKDPLSVVSGVARIIVGGERRYAMRLWLDRRAMAARQVTVSDISDRLRDENIELPAGRVESDQREMTIRTITRLTTPEEFRNLVLREDNGVQIRLGDVAQVEVGAENYRSGVITNGKPGIGLGIVRQANSNTLDVADGVLAQMDAMRKSIPDDIVIGIGYDESAFIRESIREVVNALVVALLLVVAVIFLFLRNLRATLVPAVAIPVSIVATFLVMDFMDYSVNVLTLLALVLAIGLVVDDAIVVLENIYRRFENGEPRLLAAVTGTKEVGFAVIATTITLVAVFIPLSFLTGTVGRLFTEFGFTLAAAVLFSSFVALTLSPMMCSRLLLHHDQESWFARSTEAIFTGMNAGYRWTLKLALAGRWVMVLVAIGVSALAYGFYKQVPEELAPTEDRGVFIIPISGPQGATLAYTTKVVDEVEELMAPFTKPGGPIQAIIGILAPAFSGPTPVNEALLIARLTDWHDRTISQQAIVGQLFPQFLAIPAARVFAINPPSLGLSGFQQPVQFVVGATDYETARAGADAVLERARSSQKVVNLRSDWEDTKPQLQVMVDRLRAADLGIDVRQIGEAIQAVMGEQRVTEYLDRAKQYEVILQAREADRATPEDLSNIFVRTSDGARLIPLSNVVTLREAGTPASLARVNRLPSVTLSGSLAPGATLGEGLAELEAIAAEVLPAGGRVDYLGQSREFKESSGSLYFTFALALLIVYLVLAAQFESFIHPFIIMTSVPLAVTGGLAALKFTGQTLNIFSQIGMIMLIGLMAKNGILIVEFANQIRDTGKSIYDSVLEASVLRLRPILMTTIATILGAVPLALGKGAGAEGRIAIGVVIVGGVSFATLLTLYIVPALYLLLARFTTSVGETTRALEELERESGTAGEGAEPV